MQPHEIEKRLAIAAAFEADRQMTYAAAKARFHTSSKVVASARSRLASEWRELLEARRAPRSGAGPASTSSSSHVAYDIHERRKGKVTIYQAREEGVVDWTTCDPETTLGMVLDDLASGGRELVAILFKGRGDEPGTWWYKAVFKIPP